MSRRTRTIEELDSEIARLTEEREALKAKQVAEVVSNIKDAIARYELTRDDLFGVKRRGGSQGDGRKRAAAANVGAAYQDGAGNSWGGRGPRPKWLRAALQAGRSLEEFRVAR